MAESPIGGSLAPLKHVIRRQLLRCLNESEDPRSPESLAEQVQQEVASTSYHLQALAGAHMAKQEVRKRKRAPAQCLYSSTVKDDPAVQKILDETAESDEQRLPRNPT